MPRPLRPAVLLALALLGLTATTASGTVRISANDSSVDEGAGALRFTVTHDVGFSSNATVTLTGQGSLAHCPGTPPADLESCSVSVPLSSIVPSETVSFPIVADAFDEADEEFVAVVTATGEIVDPAFDRATSAIADDDDPPQIAVGPASAPEGTGAETTLSLPVTLSAPSGKTVRANYATALGSAAADDVGERAGRITFAPGQTAAVASVKVVPDALDEDDETVAASLSSLSETSLAPGGGTATGTIVDDDTSAASVGDITLREGAGPATLTVTLSGPSSRVVEIPYATEDGSAKAGFDFTATSGKVRFEPGQTSAPVPVVLFDDTVPEPEEGFGVRLVDPTGGAVLARSVATATITDDDPAAGGGAGGGVGGSGGSFPGAGPGVDQTDAKGPRVGLARVRLSGRRLSVDVTCPKDETSCRTKLTLFVTLGDLKRGKETNLARRTVRLAGGVTKRVTVTLSKSRAALVRRRRAQTTAFAVTRDAVGNTAVAQKRARLR